MRPRTMNGRVETHVIHSHTHTLAFRFEKLKIINKMRERKEYKNTSDERAQYALGVTLL